MPLAKRPRSEIDELLLCRVSGNPGILMGPGIAVNLENDGSFQKDGMKIWVVRKYVQSLIQV